MSRCSSWDGYEDSERVSIINDSLSSGDELPSPHASQTHEPESEAEPSPPPAAASPEPSPPPAAASTASSSTSPPLPPEASIYSNCSDTGFYVVWRPEYISGIWIGPGKCAWWSLVQGLPNKRYEPGICRLRRANAWAEAWNLWWTGGPAKQEVAPFIYVV